METQVEERNKDYNLPVVTTDSEDQSKIMRFIVPEAAHESTFSPFQIMNIQQEADGENGCLTNGNSFSHQNGEQNMTAPSCTTDPEPDQVLMRSRRTTRSMTITLMTIVTLILLVTCRDDDPVSPDEVVGHNDATMALDDANGKTRSMEAIRKETRSLCYCIVGISASYLASPMRSVDLIHHWHLIFQFVCIYVAFFSSSGVLLHSIVDENFNPPTKGVLLYQMLALSVTAIIPTLISIIIGIVNNIEPTSKALDMGCASFIVWVPVVVIVTVVAIIKKKQLSTSNSNSLLEEQPHVGDIESQMRAADANDNMENQIGKATLRSLCYCIVGISASYLVNPMGRVDVLHRWYLTFQLACLYVAFFSSCGVLAHSIVEEELNPPTKGVLLYQMVSLSVTAIIPTVVSIFTGIVNNVNGPASWVLTMGSVAFLLLVPTGVTSIVILTTRKKDLRK